MMSECDPMSQRYVPITCAIHNEYEIAVMQKKHINIKWLDADGKQHVAKVIAEDIRVKNKEEFLIARTHDDKELVIRLDRVTLIDH